MNSSSVNVMQILLQLFQLLFLANIVNARLIKLQTKWENSRAVGSATHDKRKKKEKNTHKAKVFLVSVKLIESNRWENVGAHITTPFSPVTKHSKHVNATNIVSCQTYAFLMPKSVGRKAFSASSASVIPDKECDTRGTYLYLACKNF